MKLLSLLLLALSAAWAQNAGPVYVDWLDSAGDVINVPPGLTGDYKLVYQFSYIGGVKVLSYSVYSCGNYDVGYEGLGVLTNSPHGINNCILIAQPITDGFSGVQEVVNPFLTFVLSNFVPFDIVYGQLSRGVSPHLTITQPATLPNPFIDVLDGLGGSLFQVDLTTGVTLAQVALPQTALGPFALRPSTNEVWVANAGSQITVVNIGSKSVVAEIPTPSLQVGNTMSAGLAFTNDGAIALYAVSYFTPDASGNTGALLAVDAVHRVVTSTLQLKNGPTALVMAPDSLTAYLLSSSGQITYYDVLSNSADLTVSTYTPGMGGGYGNGKVFVHPDGTRLFWNVGPFLESFDLTARKVTAQFSSGLPTTSGVAVQLSQDGATATMSNGAGTVVVMDTLHGIVFSQIQNGGPTLAFLGQ